MVIKLKDIALLCQKIINDFEPSIPEIELTKDFYMTHIERYDIDVGNEEKVGVGSLFEDMEFLNQLLTDEDRVVTVVDFQKLGNILIYIGDELGK